jgi:hypothetical protein
VSDCTGPRFPSLVPGTKRGEQGGANGAKWSKGDDVSLLLIVLLVLLIAAAAGGGILVSKLLWLLLLVALVVLLVGLLSGRTTV